MKSKVITFSPEEDLDYRLGRLTNFMRLPLETCFIFGGTLMTKKGEFTATQYFEDGRTMKNDFSEDVHVFIHEVEYKHIKEKENV